MGLAVEWSTDLLGDGVVRLTLTGSLLLDEIEDAFADAARSALSNVAACILVDASEMPGLGGAELRPILEAWARLAPGRPAVVLIDSFAVESAIAATMAMADAGQLTALCVDEHRALARAVELGRLWLAQPGAGLRGPRAVQSLPRELGFELRSRLGWRRAASPGPERVH